VALNRFTWFIQIQNSDSGFVFVGFKYLEAAEFDLKGKLNEPQFQLPPPGSHGLN